MLQASKLEGLLSAFDQSNSLYALSTPDGRVRIFDTVTGRLRSTLESGVGPLPSKTITGGINGHLAEGHTCLTWLSQEKRHKPSQAPARTLLAVGTSSGSVKCFDSATGEIQWQATECNEGGVSCLAHSSRQSSVLLSSGPDGQVCSINTATGSKQGQFKGSKHAIAAAALSADGKKLVVGGSTLSLWEVSAQQRLAKYTGHPLPVRELTFAPSGSFALSAAEGERLVAVWPTAAAADKKKKKGSGVAAASLAVEQPVVGITTAAADAAGADCFYVAATTSSGEVYCWLIRPQGDSAVSSTQLARLSLGKAKAATSSSSSSDCILAAALEPAEQGVTLLLAVGSSATPHFQRVPITSTAADSSITYLQPQVASGLITTANGPSAGKAAAVQQMDVDVLGPENGGVAVQQRLAGSSSRKRQEPEPDGQAAADEAAAAAAADDEDDEDEELLESGEQTLGQRVAELERQHQAVVAGFDTEQEAAAGTSGAEQFSAGPIKADSLGVLLTQALRSSDRALLEQCLGVANDRVISNTVKRLVPMDAALLLRAAVDRLQSKPARGQQLAAWIQAVLLHHTAYLMAAPGAAPVMSSLYQIIEARLAMQRQLLSLTGRLELLLAQSGAQRGAAADEAEPGPQVVYQESDSEAEVELVDAAVVDSDLDDDEFESETDDEEEQESGDEEDDEDSQ